MKPRFLLTLNERETMKNNQHQRDAKRIIHSQHNVLPFVPREALPSVARGFAKQLNLPQKTMLKAMARYVRLHLGA